MYIQQITNEGVMRNARKRGNNVFNRRIALLAFENEWSAYRIWVHLLKDESTMFDQFPVSYPLVLRRVKLYQANRADFERYYNHGMTLTERAVFERRMKLA